MRFRHRDGSVLHLAYCSNVHPAEEIEGVVAQLARFAAPVRVELGVPRLGIGLWIAAPAVDRLLRDPARVDELRAELARLGLEVVTCNGFPFRAFHAPVVKRAVYVPDWSEDDRLDYTLGLARILARLLPDDVDSGSVSTLPLGWRTGRRNGVEAKAQRNLGLLAEGLARTAVATGKRIRVGLEPEPGCALETVAAAPQALRGLDPEWVGVCVDACHLAVQFEDPAAALAVLADAGVPVVKAQVSSALRVAAPRSPVGEALLEQFDEPRFLHQTRERTTAGVVGVDDLDEALAGGLPGETEWRVHFHTPVHAPGPGTTQRELVETLRALIGGPTALTQHLEVETYTWSVLPAGERPTDDLGLVAGLARELDWTRERLLELGLEELT